MFLPPRGLRKCRKVWDDHENGKQLFVCRSMQILLHNNQLFNWHRNRTVDAARQPGLIAQIKQDAFVPDVVYVFTTNQQAKKGAFEKCGPYQIYDGGHRTEAARQLAREGIDVKMLVAVRILEPGESEDVIYEEYVAKNQRVPVANQLLDSDSDPKLKEAAKGCRQKVELRYRKIFSPSRGFKVPNVNRDALEECIYDVAVEAGLGSSDASSVQLQAGLEACIWGINDQFKEDLGPNTYEKAQKTGCFLFAKRLEGFRKALKEELEAKFGHLHHQI